LRRHLSSVRPDRHINRSDHETSIDLEETMTRKASTAIAVLAIAALYTTGATPAHATVPAAEVLLVSQPLRDLQPASADPLDGARATLLMVNEAGRSQVMMQIHGIERSAAGRTFGAHLHVGPCVAGEPAAAGPHYNADVAAGLLPARVGPTTEVWLDFTVNPAGAATAVAHVPFIPVPGNHSVVIHRDPTDEHGIAGPRLACLPVSW